MTKSVSKRPYLLRAMYEWMTDNLQTPHIVVDAEAGEVQVPEEYVKEGKIILNVSTGATEHLHLGNQRVEFKARFGGVSRNVKIPVQAVLAIYARESGQGMIFTDEEPAQSPKGDDRDAGDRPSLKVVKDDNAEPPPESSDRPAAKRPDLKVID